MKFDRLRCLRGPNRWAACPVVEATLVLREGASPLGEQVGQVVRRLPDEILGRTLPDVSPDDPSLQLARVLGLIALKLQQSAGCPVSFTAAQLSPDASTMTFAVEFVEESVGAAAAELALDLFQVASAGREFSLQEHLDHLRALEFQQRLPASTAVVCRAARARGIPARRLNPEYGRYLILGQGAKQRRCLASETDAISGVARSASTDKYLAKELLRAVGVPVPEGRLVSNAEEAWTSACELGVPVVTKPLDSDLATGVSLDLRSRTQVEAGFRCASEHSAWVLVERFAPGLEHRVLVVADEVVAVTRIAPPHVTGDGVSTVAELVERVNRDPRRGDEGSGCPLRRLKIDAVALEVLADQGWGLASVPPAGQQVLVRRNPPYFKNGGTLVDLTDQIHPSIASHAVAAAQALQLRVAGLDVVVGDIARPLEEQGGVVVEINAGPGLWLHMAPWADSPRPVGEAIVRSLFPPGQDGRIPVVALVGDACGTVKRHLSALLTGAGLRVGWVSEREVVVGPRRWPAPLKSPQDRAGLLLQNPAIDAAFLETTSDELVRNGFGTDRCEVAVVLDQEQPGNGNLQHLEIGQAPSGFLHALKHALSPAGAFVLPIDGLQAAVEADIPLARVFLIGRAGEASRVHDHVAVGGRALVMAPEQLVLVQAAVPPRALGKWPDGMTGETARGLLAALAAALVLGQEVGQVQDYLSSLR